MRRVGAALAVISLIASGVSAWASPLATTRLVHVVHPASGTPYLADGQGRQLLLRGGTLNGLVQYNTDYAEAVPVTAADLQEMAALGFNFVRLSVSWSRIMPRPGAIDTSYLRQVAKVASWAELRGIYVLADMHQDRYNRHLYPGHEVDGAPDWATVTHGAPCGDVFGKTSSCAQVAEQVFWSNTTVAGKPLWVWYRQAITALARTVGNHPMVAGVELMNEPTEGTVPPGGFETSELYPFYRAMIAGLRGAGVRVPLWFEPSILRDVTDDARAGAMQFSTDPNLVYAVHIYTDVFSPPFNGNDSRSHLQQSFANAVAEARLYGTAWVDDEFGADPTWDHWLTEELSLQDQYLVGSAFWIWKQPPQFYHWGTVALNGALRPDTLRAQLLSRPHVLSIPGRLLAVALGARARLTAVVAGPGGTLLLWSGTQVVQGGRSLLTRPLTRVLVDGRLVTATCQPIRFHSRVVTLAGCRVAVRLPAGRHTVRLS